jgi:hypothetical protein
MPKKPGHLLRMAQHHDERDRPAPVVGGEFDGRDAQAIQDDGEVVGHVVLAIAAAGRRTPARAAQVRAQHPVAVGGQRNDQFVPLPPVLGEAVDQHRRRPVGRARIGDVDRHTIPEIHEPVFDTVQRGHNDHVLTRYWMPEVSYPRNRSTHGAKRARSALSFSPNISYDVSTYPSRPRWWPAR